MLSRFKGINLVKKTERFGRMMIDPRNLNIGLARIHNIKRLGLEMKLSYVCTVKPFVWVIQHRAWSHRMSQNDKAAKDPPKICMDTLAKLDRSAIELAFSTSMDNHSALYI